MNPPHYSERPLARTHAPATVEGRATRYETLRDCLRLDFAFRCVYCLASEPEVAPMARYGGFEIEHFKPKAQFRKLRHTYKNLLWSCAECNRAKGNRWPSIELQAAGNRFVDPSSEGLGKHVEMDANSAVRHRTQAGWYIVNQLKLNSELHRERRKRRAIRATRYTLLLATIEVQAKDLEELQARGEDVSIETQLLVELKRDLTACEEVLKPTLPFNGPLACHACVPPRGVADRSAQLQD